MFFVDFKEAPKPPKPKIPKVSCPLCFKRVQPQNLAYHKKSSLCKKNMIPYHRYFKANQDGLYCTL